MGVDRLVQLVAAVILALSIGTAGWLLPRIVDRAQAAQLRYTDVAIDGAPPIVALGTAIGALRGVIADYLWIRVMIMKEQGQYYEVMADADLITKLQPRFAEVWAFHGHNMAYNISVVTNTPEERWSWVKAGINLVRNQGIRYNPNNLILHKELAFWFAHKIEANSDDAHLYYKREFGREWHLLLGAPPYDWEERTAWIKKIADAPQTLEEAEARTPGVKALIGRLQGELSPYEKKFKFELNGKLLRLYGTADAVTTSPYAIIMGLHDSFKANDPIYNVFYAIIHDESLTAQRETFLAFLRKKVLLDEYNMDPQLMYEFTRDIGPIDWRHGQAHALYWSARGQKYAEHRYLADDTEYRVINTDRGRIQAMQGLTNDGLVNVDPFSNEMSPSRLPDLRWIKPVAKTFRELYDKFWETEGAGSDTFIAFYENYLSNVIRQLYRAGEVDQAQGYLNELDDLFGRGGRIPNTKYAKDLDVFVREVTQEEYENVPLVAVTDVMQALRRGFHEGLLYNKPKLLSDALKFASEVREYFQGTKYADFVNKFGVGRISELIGTLRNCVELVFTDLIIDQRIPLLDRLEIYRKATDEFKRMAFDSARPQIEAELKSSALGTKLSIDKAMPEPPGMPEYRMKLAVRQQQEKAEDEARNRGDFQKR